MKICTREENVDLVSLPTPFSLSLSRSLSLLTFILFSCSLWGYPGRLLLRSGTLGSRLLWDCGTTGSWQGKDTYSTYCTHANKQLVSIYDFLMQLVTTLSGEELVIVICSQLSDPEISKGGEGVVRIGVANRDVRVQMIFI